MPNITSSDYDQTELNMLSTSNQGSLANSSQGLSVMRLPSAWLGRGDISLSTTKIRDTTIQVADSHNGLITDPQELYTIFSRFWKIKQY